MNPLLIGKHLMDLVVAIGIDRAFVSTEVSDRMKKLKESAEAIAQYRPVAMEYIATKSIPNRAALLRKHEDAVRTGDLLRANRIEDAYTLAYLKFQDEKLGNAKERDQMLRRAYKRFASAAANPDPVKYEAMLEFYEKGQWRAYLRTGRKIAGDVWRIATDNKSARRAKEYVSDPNQGLADFRKHRARTQASMRQASQRMTDARTRSRGVARGPKGFARRHRFLIDLLQELGLTVVTCALLYAIARYGKGLLW